MSPTGFKPTLAATLKSVDSLNFSRGWVASYKLDGVRAIVIDEVVMSRSLKPIKNDHVQALFGNPENNWLDGELIVDEPNAPDTYNKTIRGVMTKGGQPNVRFFVFDRLDSKFGFQHRYATLPQTHDHIVRLPHHYISTKQGFLDFEEKALNEGYEGVCLRHPEGPVKSGRSTLNEGYLIKCKRMASDEAEIVGVVELQRNMNEAKTNALGHTERSSHKENQIPGGVMGTLKVKSLTDGCEFEIGTGFTAEDRTYFWENQADAIGKIVTYNHFPIGRVVLPRHPSYKGFRDPEDMS